MTGDIRNLLQELKRGLQVLYGDRLRGVYLFGSHARAEADEESDVDVAIVLDDIESYEEEIKRTSNLVAELSLKYDASISTVKIKETTWQEDDFPFYVNLRKEGIRI